VGKSWVSVRRCERSVDTKFWQSITAVPVTESIAQGCNVELQLSINTWWSLAFEAFEDDCLMASSSCSHLGVQELSWSNLQAEDSYAYPSWLCVVV